ncbi:MAG: hypothetical protein K6T29_04700 [Peptococcaceae bacterium]|nr:hypothetical protein [Peptococcaceae bacterium]
MKIEQTADKNAEQRHGANYERFKELYKGGVISKKDFDDVEPVTTQDVRNKIGTIRGDLPQDSEPFFTTIIWA